MKVLHFGTLDLNAGGPAMSTYYTLLGLQKLRLNVQLIMYPLSKNGRLLGNEIPVNIAKIPVENKFSFSPSLITEINLLGSFDIYHAQGVWQYPTYALALLARKKRKPYLITPRGMLYPQDIAKASTLFKKISLKLKLLKDLNRASCVHATCIEEMEHLRNLGVTSPIAVIPNPIQIKESYPAKKDNIFRLGYLGRLSPRKNVESLIYAWKKLESKTANGELLIIGSDDPEYEDFLKNEVAKSGLTNVRFMGFLSGKEKDEALASLSMLAMPSEFENFGNVILEGLIREIPCLATKGSPWEELETKNCGWWVEHNDQAIEEAINQALSLSESKLKEMGKNGKKLVVKSYSMEAAASQMLQVYRWLLKEDLKPNYVYSKS